jgi:simple sugar transport system permease protein
VKPELGALIGAIVVFVFFAVQSPVFRSPRGIAKWLEPASTLGIILITHNPHHAIRWATGSWC